MSDIRREIEKAKKSKKITQGQRDNLIDFTNTPGTPEYAHPRDTKEEKKQEYSMFRARIRQLYDGVVAPTAPRQTDDFA
jgi:hypothetical protein